MDSERVIGETKSQSDIRRTLHWVLGAGGSLAMGYYEYLWSRFALGNLGAVSFAGWFWTSLTMASPWIFCFLCIFQLRESAKNGSLGRDVWLIAISADMVMLCAYWMLAPEIHRLTTLGVLK
jgi:hypothetical protein